jgi:hypothetical protein
VILIESNRLFCRSSQLFRSHAPTGMRLVTIYIAEAHARDQWPAGKTISSVDQPITLEQRLDNARQFKINFNFEMPILVDTMENRFHHIYGSWPFRFYIIYHDELVLDMNELDIWIEEFYRTCRMNSSLSQSNVSTN